MKSSVFHVLPIGALDMLKFTRLVPRRRKMLLSGSPNQISGEFSVNRLAACLHPKTQEVEITKIISHNPDAKTYILAGKQLAPFRAGQYIAVSIPLEGSSATRAYSIASSPALAHSGKYGITIKRVANGFGSSWMLDNWKEGDRIRISGPEGFFYYEPLRDAKHVVGVAGGSGITPFLSMAHAIADGIEDFQLTILYGSRTERDILHKVELDELCAACGKIRVVHVLSHEARESCEYGFIGAELIRKVAGEKPYSVFVCGPPAMYAHLKGEIAKLELEQKFVRQEAFGACAADQSDNRSEVYQLTVKIHGESSTIPTRADETILVALERAGIPAPSRCRSGECGWCRSRLISGETDTPQEDAKKLRDADQIYGFLHPCCSYPRSDLTLEVFPQ
jgi:ferredoxin-NADP reductase